MKMNDIQSIAKSRGVAPGRLTKADLIRAMQHAEGNAACFQTGQAVNCGQDACLWRQVCD